MTPVTKAVLLAAGRGSRLGPLTDTFPKALLQVGGEPILHRIIDALAAAGVTDVAVVTGHAAAALERETGNGERWGVRLRYFRQEALDGTAAATSLAREDVGDAPFFVGWGDIVVAAGNYARVLDAGRETGSALAVNQVDDPFAGAAVYVNDRGFVTRLVEKPPKGTAQTRWNNAGLAVLSPAIWPFIDGLQPSERGEFELPQAIASFVAASHRLKAVPIEGPWFDIGTLESLAAARGEFGE